MLIRLTYTSYLAPDHDRQDIDRIVEASGHVNQRRGITGAIAFDGKKIVQILEGPAREVDRMFGRIRTDRRHVGIVELDRFGVAERMFSDWSMTTQPIIDVIAWTHRAA